MGGTQRYRNKDSPYRQSQVYTNQGSVGLSIRPQQLSWQSAQVCNIQGKVRGSSPPQGKKFFQISSSVLTLKYITLNCGKLANGLREAGRVRSSSHKRPLCMLSLCLRLNKVWQSYNLIGTCPYARLEPTYYLYPWFLITFNFFLFSSRLKNAEIPQIASLTVARTDPFFK